MGHLAKSIKNIATHADFICVVYQSKSPDGQALTEAEVQSLKRLPIDKLVRFEPATLYPTETHLEHEVRMRNLAIDKCRAEGATYVMTLGPNDYFEPEQLKTALQWTVDEGFDTSACAVQRYYQRPNLRLEVGTTLYAPFLYKLNGRRIDLACRWPYPAVKARLMQPKRLLTFTPQQLTLHNLDYVGNPADELPPALEDKAHVFIPATNPWFDVLTRYTRFNPAKHKALTVEDGRLCEYPTRPTENVHMLVSGNFVRSRVA